MLVQKTNILSPTLLQTINDCMTKNSDFKWSLVNNTAGDEYSIDEAPSFSHLIFSKGQPVSPFWDLFTGVILPIVDASEMPFQQLRRVKIGLITKRDKKVEQGAHVDYHEPHKTILFYFHDSDGDTIFYKEKFDPLKSQPKKFTKEKTITPKANTLIGFDGWQYHSSSSPVKNGHRIVMNINFV